MGKPKSSLPNLRHLAATVAVIHRGSISAAARAIHLTQPAVTQAVSGLELAVGGRLFERNARGVVVTALGRRSGLRLERALEHVSIGLIEAGAGAGSRATLARHVTATQLLAVAEVVEADGIGPAARAAGTTRATLHRPVRELESVLGVSLLEPTSHGIRPTRAAARLARRTRLAESEWQQARAEWAAEAGHEQGKTVIGAMPFARSTILPTAILALAQQYPSHQIEILDGPYESLLDGLRHGHIDWLVGALRPVAANDVVQTPLFEDALAIVARFHHPLVRRSHVSRDDLRQEAWVVPRPASPLRLRHDELIGLSEQAAPIECNSLEAARALLLASNRLMWSSIHQVRHELDAGLLGTIRHPFGRLTRTIGLTHRRDWDPTPTQAVLLNFLRMESGSIDQEVTTGETSNPSRRRNARGATPVPRVKKREK
jgi:DNA-binding transcriptional LysR family regulator